MYNKVILAGNLTRDIEIRYTQGGSAIASTGIATTRKFKSVTGEQKKETLFIDLTFFGRTAEIANQYLKKGSKVLVDGRLKLDQWTAQDGSKRSKHGITVENLQMLGSRNEDETQPSSHTGYGRRPSASANHPQQATTASQSQNDNTKQEPYNPPIPEIDINEDEIPWHL